MGTEVLHLDIRKEYHAPEFSPTSIPSRVWKNGMVVRMPNHLGDAVMALPALIQLRNVIPENCALYVVAPENQRALYHPIREVDGVYPLEQVHRNWTWEEIIGLRRHRFGVGVLFNNSFRETLMLRLAGVSCLYGASARFRSIMLRKSFAFPPRRKLQAQGVHQTNLYLSLASALGAPAWNGKLPPLELRPSINELDPELASLCGHPQLLTIASGAAYGAAKRWPSENFREVARYWISRGGVVVVLGSVSERGIGDEVIDGLNPRKAFNLSGRTSFPELMQLLSCSVLTVANDSGLMHLSALLDRPGVAVFGPTDYTATGPVSDKWTLLYQKMGCGPCFRRECPRKTMDCIKSITPELVIAEVTKIARIGGAVL